MLLNLVMDGIENFLSRLLKDKIPRYHGILPCSDFYILINILLRNLHLILQLLSKRNFLSNKVSDAS